MLQINSFRISPEIYWASHILTKSNNNIILICGESRCNLSLFYFFGLMMNWDLRFEIWDFVYFAKNLVAQLESSAFQRKCLEFKHYCNYQFFFFFKKNIICYKNIVKFC